MYQNDGGALKAPDDGPAQPAATTILTVGHLHFRRFVHFHRARLDSFFYTPSHQHGVMPSKEVVRIEDRQDRWRFVCPRGHRSWEPTNHHFWCQKCAARDDVDGVFYELRDKKTDALLQRDQVRLVTSVGPYDRDLDTEGSA